MSISAAKSLFGLPQSREKTEIRLMVGSELADRVRKIKVELKEKSGVYFSVGSICEIALESAVRQAERELRKSIDDDDDEMTVL